MSKEHLERERQKEFIAKMVANGYQLFEPKNYEDIKVNFKKQLENINNIKLTEAEFVRFYQKINQGSVFERSNKLLREEDIILDNGDVKVLELMNKEKWCANNFQIAKEVKTEDGSAIFDSIIFINGLPLVIMEFKQSRVGLKQGIEQIIGYQQHGKFHDLFLYCQIFVVSSFASTRYFANNNKINRDFIFKWTDENNEDISALIDGNKTFYDTFLSRCFVAEMIVRYMVQKESDKINIILRPYQVYATKKILEKVKANNGGGFIFHTTGSGKTITSFKTCRLLSQNKDIDKVIFLVDRKDLDTQTKNSYKEFEEGSYEGANNSYQLKKALFNNSNQIIVATVQKLTRVINDLTAEEQVILQQKRTVLIIDECHRSQSDTTVNTLRKVFIKNQNAQYFGFTGTPICKENAKSGITNYKTTKSVFDKELHRYSITNAVADENVLQFNISQPQNIEELDQDHLNQDRIAAISKYIIDSYNNYNDNRQFNAILATTSKEQLQIYYQELKKYNDSVALDQQIKFSCIFSTNADDADEYVGNIENKQFINTVINDYNQMFNSNLQANDIDGFKNKIYENVRKKELDLIIVVNMLLTGFDSPLTKTLYVDKPLRYHGLLQAYSRVNRLSPNKRFGNVVTFIEQKTDRDQALKLFSAGGTYTDFEIKPYSELIENFNYQLAVTTSFCQDGDELRSQLRNGDVRQIENSLKAIKELQKQYSFLKINPDFNEEDMNISKKELNDLKDVYREVYRAFNGKIDNPEQSEIDTPEVEQLLFDFEINAFDEDQINLKYLLDLTQKAADEKDYKKAITIIEHSDLSGELRGGMIKSVDAYQENQSQQIVEYLYQIMRQQQLDKYEEYAKANGIEDTEMFYQVVDKQEKDNLSRSQANEYDKAKKVTGLGAKRKFRRQTYEYVEDVMKRYDLKEKM